MGLGTNQTGVVVADKWIGEIWQDEAVATYMAKTVMRNLVEVFQHEKTKATPSTDRNLVVGVQAQR